MADVHVAIGVGRAIVKDELFTARAGFAHGAVNVHFLPARQYARLLLGQAGLHGEIGLRQEDGVSIVALFAHGPAP